MSYGAFVDHLPSVLLLVAIAVACFACSTTGRTSPDNRRPHTSANGEARRVVGRAPARSGAPSTPAQTPGSRRTPRRPETRSAT